MNDKRPGRFYLLTLGCPKNLVDSEGMSELLVDTGYLATDRLEEADYIIVNTCGFLEAARAEAVETLEVLGEGKEAHQRLIAAGCLAQRDGAGLADQVPGLDGIIGIRSWTDIVRFLEKLRTYDGKRPLTHIPEAGHILVEQMPLRRTDYGPRASAYLKIGDGCSAGCAFCTIPSIKGPGRSRPKDLLLGEARRLVDLGVMELIMIAQDTTAYGLERGEIHGLPCLIEDVLQAVPDLRWLRLMYTYPGHLDEQLIEVMATHDQVCHYLDVPLQHGHPDTLRRMWRPHDVGKVTRWIERLRLAVPDVALRTTFIVGYPGETSAEFEGLLDFMGEVQFDRMGVFQFSPEPGTPAFDLPRQIPDEEKQTRYEQAMEYQQAISLAKNRHQIDRQLPVLVEGVGDGISVARSYRDAPEIDGLVLIEEELPVDKMITVRITDAGEYDLMAVRSFYGQSGVQGDD